MFPPSPSHPIVHHPTDRPNFYIVTTPHDGTEYAFSYQTCIGVYWYDPETDSTHTAVHENDWGPTTGKHLNFITEMWQHSAGRLSADDFARTLQLVKETHA